MPHLTEKEAASIVTEQSDATDIARNDYVLGSQITAETLNQIIPEGPNKGQSVAFWLAGIPAGQALLSHGNPSLRSQIDTETLNQVIDKETLNQVIEEGKYKGTSSDRPIQSTLLQACDIPMEEVKFASREGLGLFDETQGVTQKKDLNLKLPVSTNELHEGESVNLERLQPFGGRQEGRNQKKSSPREDKSTACASVVEHENAKDTKQTTLTSKQCN